MRINKLLSNLGYCSRRDANRWIEEGYLTVNGALCQQGQWLEKNDQVLLKGEPLVQQEKIYILLNKPTGITCTAETKEPTNIIGFMNFPQYIFPVGRLDKDSEGLMFLTNDGILAHEVLVSDNDHEKEYVVTVQEAINEAFIENMSRGVLIDGMMTKTCTVKPMSEQTFSITLCQGLNRQIRKMCHAFGYKVVKLQRIRIMNLHLGALEMGTWRYVTDEELEALKKQVEKLGRGDDMTNSYEIIEGMTAEELDYIQQSLWTYNVQTMPPSNDLKKNVHLVIKSEDQQIIAGLIGKIYRGCLFVDTLWVHEDHRKEGFGQRLLDQAETLATKNGCWFIHLDTFSFQAPEFYKKNGFEVFGTLDGYPDGIVRYYLKKELPR